MLAADCNHGGGFESRLWLDEACIFSRRCEKCGLGSEFSQEFDRSQGPKVELRDSGKVPDVVGGDGSTPGGNRQLKDQIVFRTREKWTQKKVHLLAPGHRAEIVDDRIRCF